MLLVESLTDTLEMLINCSVMGFPGTQGCIMEWCIIYGGMLIATSNLFT